MADQVLTVVKCDGNGGVLGGGRVSFAVRSQWH